MFVLIHYYMEHTAFAEVVANGWQGNAGGPSNESVTGVGGAWILLT
jgi:hypothetical protein